MSLRARLISVAVRVLDSGRPTTGGRIEVCVPASTRGRRTGWRSWLRRCQPHRSAFLSVSIGSGDDDEGRPDRDLENLLAARHDFIEALDDVDTLLSGRLLERIRAARSLRELWHLRPEVFDRVARCHAQAEADLRLAALNRHFPTRSPRSGFGTLS